MTDIILRNLHHAYGSTPVIRDVSLRAESGKLTCLVGPSGCGKSTLLRLIAGLERIQRGTILLGDEVLAEAGSRDMPARARNVGLVFQHPSLFPHLTVNENIAFGLHGKPKKERAGIIDYLLEAISLTQVAHAYPHQLSGGQHQRVALARALAPQPRVMLLDEPFANLDHALRRDMREEIMVMLKQVGAPILMVTHDPDEALAIADQMVLLRADGTLHQQGTPHQIHDMPVDATAAAFFGSINRLQGRVTPHGIETLLGYLPKDTLAPVIPEGTKVEVVTRPEGIRLAAAHENGTEIHIEKIRHTGVGWRVHATLENHEGLIKFSHIHGALPQPGTKARVTFAPPHIFVFGD